MTAATLAKHDQAAQELQAWFKRWEGQLPAERVATVAIYGAMAHLDLMGKTQSEKLALSEMIAIAARR